MSAAHADLTFFTRGKRMHRGNLSRRGFLQRSLGALVAAGLPAWYAQEILTRQAAAQEKKAAANDKLVFGAIGIGSPQSRGLAVVKNDLLKGFPSTECVAVCDVDRSHRERAAKEVNAAKQYEDFRELNDRKDINAVVIATPDHWHALVAIDALRKGKDVYCEKPLSLTIAEGRAIAKVAKETGKIFQVGTQQRSDKRFRLACELVRNGRIGKVKTIETRIGANPTSPVIPAVPPPEGLNWDLWLGPTPKTEYRYLKQEGKPALTNCHYEFRWFYQWSGGKMTDWGAHHNDIAQWALGMDDSGPVAVEATGDAPSMTNDRYDTHPHFKVTYTYDNGVKLFCMSDGENGIRFEGEDGKWIFVSRSKIEASDKKLIEEPLPSNATRLYVSDNHMGNFLACVKDRKPTICPAELGHRSVTVCHLGVIALRLGKKFKWDPVTEKADLAEVNAQLSRPYRAPWKLEV
jgi:predicted dehydrogenase